MTAEITPLVHASESGHYYHRDGRPCYEVPSADGKKMVSPTIVHARKMGLVPGVTSIINCAAKPALTAWLVEQAILASLTLPRRPHEPDRDYLRRVYDDAQEQGKKAAQVGTDVHAAVEQFYSGRTYDPAFKPYVDGVSSEIEKLFGRQEWVAEESFACRLGYGSKIDLREKSGKIILDFKGKEFAEVPTKANKIKLAWDEHAMQLAAYDYAMDPDAASIWTNNNTILANVFFSRSVPGLVHIHVWEQEELDRGWRQFRSLLDYWQASKRYSSAWRHI